MTQKDVLGGGALAELAGPLKDFFEKLGGPDSEQWFTGFKKFLRKENFWNPMIVHINRSVPFNPAEFISKGWSIEEEDERSLALTEVDLSKVRFETCLKPDESRVKGEEKLRRLKKLGHVRLDAKIFQFLWENKKLIPESWKEKINGNTRYIFFDGTILRSPDGDRYVLCLYWDDGVWDWNAYWLEDDWDAHCPSVVLAS